jgi:hypothetical protein
MAGSCRAAARLATCDPSSRRKPGPQDETSRRVSPRSRLSPDDAARELIHVYPRYPRYPQAESPIQRLARLANRSNLLLSRGSGLPETEETVPETAERKAADVRKDENRNKRGPGNRKEEARGGGASQCRTHFPSRVRRNPKPPGGRNRERTRRSFASSESGRETSIEAERRRKKTRQGTEAGRKAGRGTRRNLNRNSDIHGSWNLRDRPGPQGLGRNLPGKARLAFGRDETDLGTVEAGGNVGLHFCLGPRSFGPSVPSEGWDPVE